MSRSPRRSLRNRSAQTIGVIVPDVSDSFYGAIVDGVEQVAYDRGYCTIICNSYRLQEREEQYLHVLNSELIAGVVLVPSSRVPGAALRRCSTAARLSCVSTTRWTACRSIPSCSTMSVLSGRRCLTCLSRPPAYRAVHPDGQLGQSQRMPRRLHCRAVRCGHRRRLQHLCACAASDPESSYRQTARLLNLPPTAGQAPCW